MAKHNVKKAGEDTEKDPHLISFGHNQAKQTGSLLRKDLQNKLDAVIVSPLTRCLQTTKGIVEEVGFQGNWIAREELREAFGITYSNMRNTQSHLKAQRAHVNFQDTTEEDEWWKPDRRETWQNLQQRVDRFLHWASWNQLVGSTPHGSNLLVVSHGVWIECFLSRYYSKLFEEGKRVYNCDTFCSALVCNWEKENDQWICKKIQIYHTKRVIKKHFQMF